MIALALALASFSAPASAQSGGAGDAEARALRLFEQSATAYHEGRFSEAAALLEEAYALHPEPLLLYNRARALDAEGDLSGALVDYRRFLDASPDASQAPLARGRVEVLGAQLAEREAHEREVAAAAARREPAPTDPPIASPPLADAPSSPDLLAPGLVLGAGLAVVIVGSVVLGVAVQRHDEAAGAPIQADAARLDREALGLRDAGGAVLGIGAAVVVGAAVWMAVVATSSSSSTTPSLALGPGTVSISGRF